MKTNIFLLFSSMCLICIINANQIHKRMTIKELRSTFHVDSHDLVPDYEVVNIHHVRRRSIDSGGGGISDKVNKSKSVSSNSVLVNNVLIKDDLIKSIRNKEKQSDTEQQQQQHQQEQERKQQGTNVVSDEYDDDDNDKMTELRLKAFGKPLNLSLIRTEGLIKTGGLKIWSVEPNATAQHGVEYIELPQTNDDIGEIYQDEANEAAILLRKDETTGDLLVEGSIGSDLVIRPIPMHLRQQHPPDLNDDEMYLDQEDGEEVAIDTGLPIKRPTKKKKTKSIHRLAQHIVYKKKAKIDEEMSDYAFMEPDNLRKRYRKKRSIELEEDTQSSSSRKKREAPYIIYPEILVIVDYDGYRLHDGDNVKIKRYFVSFWNGVDLRYKLLKGPKIRISIAGIIISRGRDATPYLERNRVGRDAIDSAAALTDMGKYLFRERRLPVYDIAVAITKYDMCRRRKGGRCTKGTAGFAYVGGACVVNKRLEKVNSVAIIEDTGGFSGIIVAAHEVGHLLGAVHDGSPPPSYLGGPGAEKCRWEDGYIMSDLRHTERGFRWSPCSVSSFHHFLNGDTATCLYNAPHEDDSLPRVLPGKLLTLDAQCRRDRGTSACFKDDRVCAQLFCFDSGSGYCVAYRPAAEGSPCGDGQYCLNGRCVAEHENIIPDYSQNTPSYIRRQDESQGRPLFYEEEAVHQQYEQTEPPYYQQYTTTQNPYSQYQQQQQYDPYSTTTTTEINPYNYYTSTQTPAPYQNPYQYYSTTTSNPYSYYSTTSKPYYQYYTTASNSYASSATTRNPYIGDYYLLRSKTTKNPYDFGNFGRTTQNHDDVNNNYLKRSYNSASYFAANTNRNNVTVALAGTGTKRY